MRNVGLIVVATLSFWPAGCGGDLNEDLVATVEGADATAVQALLSKGARTDLKTSDGKTILMVAAEKGTVKLTDLVPNQRLGKSLSC